MKKVEVEPSVFKVVSSSLCEEQQIWTVVCVSVSEEWGETERPHVIFSFLPSVVMIKAYVWANANKSSCYISAVLSLFYIKLNMFSV